VAWDEEALGELSLPDVGLVRIWINGNDRKWSVTFGTGDGEVGDGGPVAGRNVILRCGICCVSRTRMNHSWGASCSWPARVRALVCLHLYGCLLALKLAARCTSSSEGAQKVQDSTAVDFVTRQLPQRHFCTVAFCCQPLGHPPGCLDTPANWQQFSPSSFSQPETLLSLLSSPEGAAPIRWGDQ